MRDPPDRLLYAVYIWSLVIGQRPTGHRNGDDRLIFAHVAFDESVDSHRASSLFIYIGALGDSKYPLY